MKMPVHTKGPAFLPFNIVSLRLNRQFTIFLYPLPTKSFAVKSV